MNQTDKSDKFGNNGAVTVKFTSCDMASRHKHTDTSFVEIPYIVPKIALRMQLLE